mgnify:CR=1 FL=1|jgi:hypothetical protein
MPHPNPLPTPNQSADRTSLTRHSSLVHSGSQLSCLPLLHLLPAGPCGLQCHIAASACAVGEGFQPRPPICCVPPGSLCLPFLRPWLLEWNRTLSGLSSPPCLCRSMGKGWAICPLVPPLPGQVIHHCQSLSNHDALTCGTCAGGRR